MGINLGILGSNMGAAAAYHMMCSEGVDNVYLGDYNEKALHTAHTHIQGTLDKLKTGRGATLHTRVVNVKDTEQVRAFMQECDSVLGAVSYEHNYTLSQLAVETKTNYVDLGGNNDIVAKQRSLHDAAKEAGINILYDCGLAPGQPSLVARDVVNRLDNVESLVFYCGGLPQEPKGPLQYAIEFSVRGLINEYVEVPTALKKGKFVELEPMGDVHELDFSRNTEFDKIDDIFRKLEAFNTSGGTSTLPETYAGKIGSITYQTLRLPGHIQQIKTLMNLGMLSYEPHITIRKKESDNAVVGPRDFVEAFLDSTLPKGGDDLIIVHARAYGTKHGNSRILKYTVVDIHDHETGLSAMQRMTAFPASIIAQMAAQGKITEKGAVPPENCVDTDYLYDELRKHGIDFTPEEV